MTYDNPPIITSTMRRYNPQTGHYESVVADPWAGAPKGIRVISSIGGGLFVMLEDSFFVYKPQGGGTWVQGSQTDVAKEVAWHASIGSEFPDFDGAPEGQRFYVKWKHLQEGWQPLVDTGEGVYRWFSDTGKWVKQLGVEGLFFFQRGSFVPDLILVDPNPEEPKAELPMPSVEHFWPKPQYEPKPGDVIRDKSNHLETWFFTGKHWDKITRCGRVEAEDFTPPKRMEIVSRAVN